MNNESSFQIKSKPIFYLENRVLTVDKKYFNVNFNLFLYILNFGLVNYKY
jgi:hypothetical protein